MTNQIPIPYAVKNRQNLWAAKGIDPSTGARKNYFGKSPEEASRKASMSFGIQDSGPDFTFYAFYRDVYLPTVKHRSYNWLRQIAWAMDTHLIPHIGHRDIREIKRAELQLAFNKIGKSMNASSLGKVKIVLTGVLRLAMADEVIPSNPAEFVRLPERDRVEKTALTFYELQSLVGASGRLIKPFVILAGCAGLRRGEALGTSTGAISRERVLSVRQQVIAIKGGAVLSDKLKTRNSYRDVPLPLPMYDALMDCGQVSDLWVCSDSKGGFVRPANIRRELEYACRDAEIQLISPHELRHTFVSLMENELEAPRRVTMSLVGHAPQGTTDRYSHVKIEQKMSVMERYWDRMSTACSPESWATDLKIAG